MLLPGMMECEEGAAAPFTSMAAFLPASVTALLLAARRARGGDVLSAGLPAGALGQQQRQCTLCKLLLLANLDRVLLPGLLGLPIVL